MRCSQLRSLAGTRFSAPPVQAVRSIPKGRQRTRPILAGRRPQQAPRSARVFWPLYTPGHVRPARCERHGRLLPHALPELAGRPYPHHEHHRFGADTRVGALQCSKACAPSEARWNFGRKPGQPNRCRRKLPAGTPAGTNSSASAARGTCRRCALGSPQARELLPGPERVEWGEEGGAPW